MRWRLYDGTLEPVRCGASNLCDYCSRLAAKETALAIKLDAVQSRPTVGLTTTTRDPDTTERELRRAEASLWRSLRREYDPLHYCGFVEWTTGEGTHSGGHRRVHIHHTVKGIPEDDPRLAPIDVDGRETTALEVEVAERWRRYTGDAFVVEVRPLRTATGAIEYLALHHRKRSQAPPPGWSGKRLRPSKGYFGGPGEIGKLRVLARRLVADSRVSYLASLAVDATYGDCEVEFDGQLTRALVSALRSMRAAPPELQLDLASGEPPPATEKAEFRARVQAELARIKAEEPPELVRVLERERVDPETGVAVREAIAVLGPVQARCRRPARQMTRPNAVEAAAA